MVRVVLLMVATYGGILAFDAGIFQYGVGPVINAQFSRVADILANPMAHR
jgi:hypothetical protein